MRNRGSIYRPLLLAGVVWIAAPPTLAEPISVDAEPIPLLAGYPEVAQIDGLAYRGGLVLDSDDSRFGGLSGLAVTPDGGRLFAVSDTGYLLTMTPVLDSDGNLAGLGEVTLEPLIRENGKDLPGIKQGADAEALTVSRDDALVVAFEHDHRLMFYDGDSPPRRTAAPAEMAFAPPNGGIEALTALPDGGYLMLSEGLETGPETVAGWFGEPGAWSMFFYQRHDKFRPTGAAALANGDIIVVERYFSILDGQDTRIRRIAPADLVAGAVVDSAIVAELRDPLPIDNFEGIAVHRTGSGETRLFLISDDNFNPLQQTLLLMFAIDPDGGAAAE
ncbi:MAG: esterase-like activity of phytase family protein [Alphaproteobacteria bacterium]|nr:esterase-like activity of phytase family protein [Alphaproteobacteria bacterium]